MFRRCMEALGKGIAGAFVLLAVRRLTTKFLYGVFFILAAGDAGYITKFGFTLRNILMDEYEEKVY